MNVLCIFAKPPLPGKTKRRLAAEIGDVPAAELSGLMLNYLIAESKNSNADAIYLYIPAEFASNDFKNINYNGLEIRKQIGETLGQKMANMFKECCQQNTNTILIGSDCIAQTANTINEAFHHLSSHDIVIQPAEDGGYVLIGESKYCSEIFNGPKWGGSNVFEVTVNILKDKGKSYYVLPESFDIDVKEDLVKLHTLVETKNNFEIKRWLEKYSF